MFCYILSYILETISKKSNMFHLDKTQLSVLRSTRKYFASRNSIRKSKESAIKTVPESADVVIVGGGSAGCHALYYLSKRGCKAILLEKSKLTSGTTWHSAGMFWRLRPNDIDIELLDSTRKLLINLEKETGISPGWTENGGLFIAHNKTRMEEYKRLVTAGKFFGVEAYELSSKEAKNMYPLLDDKSFTGAIYSPQDGTVDPTMLVNSLMKYARNQGATIIEECAVTRILINDNGFGAANNVTGVETPYGIIRTNCVLNAAGVWSKNLSIMAGLDIPLIPMKHAYVVTEAVNGVQGMPNIRDHDSSIYLKVQGESLHIGGYEPNPVILKSLPWDFSFRLYEVDWTIFNVHVKSMIELIPKLSTTGIKSTVCGPESFTPDHKPIMGEDPRCNGFFYSCGYNSAGMMFGGGCGEQIASWIIDGRPEKHMYNYDVRRFTPAQTRDSIWANERSHEAYAKNYSIVFPHDQPLSGRKFKTDVFHDILIKYGAVMEEAQGWEQPGWYQLGKITTIEPYDYYGNYGSIINSKNNYMKTLEKEHTFDFPEHHHIIGKEVHACRNKAVLFNLSSFGKYYLCGPQSRDAANYLFTANVDRELNRTAYTCTLNVKGGIEGDCTVTLIDSGSGGAVDPIFQGKAFYIIASGLSSYHTYSHLNKTISNQSFEVTLHDATENIGILSLQGPNSRSILEKLAETDLADNQFPFLMSKVLFIKGRIVRVFRMSFVGELGYELHIPRESCEIILNMLFKVGKIHGLQLAGFRAMYSLSCEKGYHLWGSDLRLDDNPVEAGLDFICRHHSLYQGKEVIDKLKTTGVKKKLIHVHVENNQLPLWGLETIYRNNCIVGFLRRAEYSYFYKSSIGRGYIVNPDGDNVTEEFIKTGDYSIEVMGVKYPAKVYLISPFDQFNKRLHGIYK